MLGDQVTKPQRDDRGGHLIVSTMWTENDQVTKQGISRRLRHLIIPDPAGHPAGYAI
ncbi:hypothetical protein G1H11_10730 [Phytoactinopolyspora alkaliphila]|uniref:Uncharacterized protein n=1 Tax=Phytoactinopolyspora alkaliphila TaxID=1783498 RepID=A0A6N9YLR6_9ACTN|nr:hypothetical protein [Phytoactinopolyspora alkaliphila]NED95788.1 hypothetical protein [Phytoactinopolyspora alkaliphila]